MGVVEVPLNRLRVALVDEADLELVGPFTWYARQASKNRSYALSNSKGRKRETVYMHRLILGATSGQITDHINGDGLDNRRENLRFVTARQNQWNQHAVRGCSQYKGVYWHVSHERWVAKIKRYKSDRHLGYFDNEVDAALAYDRAALSEFGEHARTNFPPRVLELLERAAHGM